MRKSHTFNYKDHSKNIFYIGLVVIALVFISSRFYSLLTKISIQTSSIKDGEVISGGGVVKIFGDAKKATNLYINGKSTSVTKDGYFEENFALPIGYNIVTITAIDKFGKTSSKAMKLNISEAAVSTAMKSNFINNN